MRSKVVLIISMLLVMSTTLQTNLTVFAQTLTHTSNEFNETGSIQLSQSGDLSLENLSISLLENPTATPIPEPLPPVGIGKYDDRDPNLVYSGDWSQQGISNLFSGTESYSTTIGSAVSLSFEGNRISLHFRQHTFFGEVTVNIDGNDVATINQYLPYEVRTGLWTSDELDSSVSHVVTFSHASGKYMSVDAISVTESESLQPSEVPTDIPTVAPTTLAPTDIPESATETIVPNPTVVQPTLVPTQPQPTEQNLTSASYGTYDDYAGKIVYNGSWYGQGVKANYASTEHYSRVIGSTASFTFTGESIAVIYRGYPNAFGNMDIAIDGQYVTTVNQNTAGITYQNQWTSGALGGGTHTITLTHMTGPYISLDGFIVSGPPTATPTKTKTPLPTNTLAPTSTKTPLPPVGYGTYDDYAGKIVYNGSWYGQGVKANYASTEHYSRVIGSTASFTFTGESIAVIYRGYPNAFGNMDIAIDGQYVTTVNQNTAGITYQNQWTSGALGGGTHTITLTHMTGPYISLDGFIVSGPPTATPTKTKTPLPTNTLAPTSTKTPLPPVGYGTYDDYAGKIVYNGSWYGQGVKQTMPVLNTTPG